MIKINLWAANGVLTDYFCGSSSIIVVMLVLLLKGTKIPLRGQYTIVPYLK